MKKTLNFIAFEGLDGTGKSTIAKLLATRIGFNYKKTPADAFQNARFIFDRSDISSEERMAFYLGDCHKISMMVEQGKIDSLVLDRYYYSTLAYHQEQSPELVPLVSPLVKTLVKPDLVILLRADFDVSLQRISSRNEGGSYEDKFLSKAFFQRIYQNYLSCIDVPILEVDNSRTLEECLLSILDQLKVHGFQLGKY